MPDLLPQQLSLVAQVKERHTPTILRKPNVIGIGVGWKRIGGMRREEYSIIVLVRRKIPLAGLEPHAVVPPQLDGIPTDVVEVGELRALQSHTERRRPCPAGMSIGHYKITAGTFGCVVRDRASGLRLILSNNHVLANVNQAAPGDPILQPGPSDGGRPESDQIAVLERFQPIDFGEAPATCAFATTFVDIVNTLARLLGSEHRLQAIRSRSQAVNTVDAALARPLDDHDILDEIYRIGEVQGTAPAVLGMQVRKSGRTTGLTAGQITVLDATVTVRYGENLKALFAGQVVTSPMSQGGDSGSLIVAADSPRAVGLLFAGSEQASIFTPIQIVLDTLQVDL